MPDEIEAVETETTGNVAGQAEPNEAAQPTAPETVTKADYEVLAKRLSQAEHVIEKTRRDNRELKRQTAEAINPTVDPLDTLRKEMAEDYLEDALERSSNSPEEREQIRDEYEHSIAKSGMTKSAIREDINKAIRLVRAEHNEKVVKEFAVTTKSKSTITNAGGSSNQERPEVKEDWKRYLNVADLEFMQRSHWPEEKMRKAALAIKAERGYR